MSVVLAWICPALNQHDLHGCSESADFLLQEAPRERERERDLSLSCNINLKSVLFFFFFIPKDL